MKLTTSFLIILLVILLAACQAETPQVAEAPEPTLAPTAGPIEQASLEAPEKTESPEPTAAADTPVEEASPEPTDQTEVSEAADAALEPREDCFVEMPEGANYECMYVQVPEFHNEENGRSIKLGVIRLLSTSDTPAEPLFFAEGGPGGSNVEQAATIAQALLDGNEDVYTDLLSTRDLVFFTQRGTLYAEPALMCSEETMAPVLEAFSAGLPTQERERVRIDATKACIDEYVAAGVDFAAYNSVENAADINSIREVLGYDQIILYGDSYGTVLSQHVMRDFPDTLSAVILDGVDTLSAPSWVTQEDAEFQSALETVIGLCVADEACSEAYPNLPQDVEAVYQKLQSEPYQLDVEGTEYFMDEELGALAFFDALYDPFTASYLPLAVDSLLNDKQDERLQILIYLVRPRFEGISYPMHYAMVCSEDPVTSVDDARSLDEVYSVVSELIRSDASSYIEMCPYLNLPVLPDETDIPISSDLPVLLLSGAFDPATPPYNAEEVLTTLPNGFSFEFPYGGHVQFLTGDPCAESIVASFIADPTTEPDSSCIAEAVLYPFALPAAELEVGGVGAGDSTTSMPDEQLELMAAIAPPPQLSDRELGVHIHECEPTQSPGINAVEGEDYYCGLFTVPQNWEEPDGPSLDLAFVVVRATEEQPASDALIFLSGGPGQSAITKPIDGYQHLRTDRDIIRLDQRGTGFSQRLGYEECLVLALQNDAPPAQIEALQAAAFNPLEEGSTPLTLDELDIPMLNDICWEQFAAQGLDPSQFTTAAGARDVVELLKALDYEGFTLHGVSYGTRLSMTIMAQMPTYDDAPALRSVVLDSTFPPSVYTIASFPRKPHDFMLQLLAECQADAACRQAYPNLDTRLAALLNGLEEEPITADEVTVTLDDVVKQLGTVPSSQAGYLPKMIAELEAGTLDTYLALRDGIVGTDPPENYVGDWDRSDPVQAFIADAVDAIGGGDAGSALFLNLIVSLLDADPLAALQAVVMETFTGETGDQLNAKLATLTPEAIAASPYVAQLQAKFAAEAGIGDPEELARLEFAKQRRDVAGRLAQPFFNTIHCVEDIPFERFEDAVNSYHDLALPQLSNLALSQTMADLCRNWPVEAASIQVKDPVSSTVPTLILQGAYDTRTPVYMGKRATRELTNSTYLLVPQIGHEVWQFAGDCAGQIATAFVQDPDADLDLSCLNARKPKWALPDGSAASQLTLEQMENATYSGIYDEPVTLADGVYEGEPFEEGGASRPVVTYFDNTLAHGDLDGDGLDDAVALLVENSGGSGSFFYAGAQLNQSGEAADAGTALLGDRVQLISMAIAEGQVTAEIVTQGPDEGMCCGTLKQRKTLALQDGRLAEMASEVLGTVALDDLMGTQWMLHRLNFDQPPLVDRTISADFADGMVSGAGGCNQYSATVTSEGDQLLTVGPIAATAMACGEELDALEADYLAALQGATGWRFFPGQLAVEYETEGEQGTLVFNPARSADAGAASN